MKILHILPHTCPNYNSSYQENVIDKHQALLGEDVTVLHKTECIIDFDDFNNNLINPIRNIGVNSFSIVKNRIEYFKGLKTILKQVNPDVIFIHGIGNIVVIQILKFIRNNSVKVFIDTHADSFNVTKQRVLRFVYHRLFIGLVVKLTAKQVNMYYGVTPERVDFAIKNYLINKSKIKLLHLGTDDSIVKNRFFLPKLLRDEINGKIVILTGGRIDEQKNQVLELIRAYETFAINNDSIVLIVFGIVDKVLSYQFNSLLNKTIFIGKLNINEIYSLSQFTKLILFPGLHSVMWEEFIGLGIPLSVTKDDNKNYLNHNNNVLFNEQNNYSYYYNLLDRIATDSSILDKLSIGAKSPTRMEFLYSNIVNGLKKDFLEL